MTLDRRELLKGLSGLAASVAFARLNGASPLEAANLPSAGLPRKQDFDLTDGFTYLNAAYTHPIPRPAGRPLSMLIHPRERSPTGTGP